MAELEYKQASHQEVGYVDGSLVGVRIMVGTNKPYSDKAKSLIYHYCQLMEAAIYQGIREIDPVLKEQVKKEREELLACFPEKPVRVEEIENRYDRDKLFPWFQVHTKIGIITIGWRRSVIMIEWSFGPTANELFPDQNVTKDGRMIHAYGYVKAKEYLFKILS